MNNYRFLFTGGPGVGKSTVLEALASMGYRVVPEAARQVIRRRLAQGWSPRPAPMAFAKQIFEQDKNQFEMVDDEAVAFFDRGLVDAIGMLVHAGAISRLEGQRLAHRFRYANSVFLFPPWEDIYTNDSERDQTFEEAVQVYQSCAQWHTTFGYSLIEVPKGTVSERVAFVLKRVGSWDG